MSDVIKRLAALSVVPTYRSAEYASWLQQKDAIAFLERNAAENEFVVYAGLPHFFAHAIFVPIRYLRAADIDDLMGWNGNPWSSSWSITYSSSGSSEKVYVAPPLDSISSKTFAKGEQLVFGREFEGHSNRKSYIEASQKFTQVFGLHYMPERYAYCRLNHLGDIEDAIRVTSLPPLGGRWGGTIVTVERRLLDEYMALTDAALVRMFDITRFTPSSFNGWSNDRQENLLREDNLIYRFAISQGEASYSRGVQIVHTTDSKKLILERFWNTGGSRPQYTSFIAYDFKNKVIAEIPCNPASLANYFTESDRPFETTPAFFRPEVLLKYKADREKYKVEDRSISCRGAWHLETYDINAAGQVHTYLVYLSRLPYEEQLYWKAFNEAPKAPISKRAYTTDFLGQFHAEHDPLENLKHQLHELDRQGAHWWKLRSGGLLGQVHYPATESADEWANEILTLDQILVEGLEEKYLREKATRLGRSPDIRLRSLKLLEQCLIGLRFEENHARTILSPLHEVHNLRSLMKGHAGGQEAKALRIEVLEKHGTYRKHFQALCADCDDSIRLIVRAFSQTTY